MKPDDIRRLFPNASQSVLAANAESAGAASFVECASSNGTLATVKRKEGDSDRILVRVTSVRKRLLDEDNLAEKYHVDCCRYAGLISSDQPEQTKIEVSQRKCEKGEEEHTLIEIFQ